MLEVLDQKSHGFCKHDLSLVDQTSAGDFLSVEYDLALRNSGSNLFNSEMWYEQKKKENFNASVLQSYISTKS